MRPADQRAAPATVEGRFLDGRGYPDAAGTLEIVQRIFRHILTISKRTRTPELDSANQGDRPRPQRTRVRCRLMRDNQLQLRYKATAGELTAQEDYRSTFPEPLPVQPGHSQLRWPDSEREDGNLVAPKT